MTLWIELSLECTRHQTTGPPHKKCIRELWVELDVIRKCVMYMETCGMNAVTIKTGAGGGE